MDVTKHIAITYEIEGLLSLLGSDAIEPQKQRDIETMIAAKAQQLVEAFQPRPSVEEPVAESTPSYTAPAVESAPQPAPVETMPSAAAPDEPTEQPADQPIPADDDEQPQQTDDEELSQLYDEVYATEPTGAHSPRAVDVNSEALFLKNEGLKQAFTLNDTFRFTRELFGNSRHDFNEAVNLVEAMSDVDEAREYFYDNLDWDKDNSDVQDFMAIVEAYLSINNH
jgi:hypothetical protein